MKTNIFILFFLITLLGYTQDCKPTLISEDGKTSYYGGNIRNGLSLITDDKSTYQFYIVQINKGQSGTVAYVSFRESVDNRKEYNDAIDDYLNDSDLKHKSYLEIQTKNTIITIYPNSCTQKSKSFLGSINAYNVYFEGDITKDQIKELQENEIVNFKFVIGGKPYERHFKKSTKFSKKIMNSISCIDLNSVFETKKKDAADLDLTEIKKEYYNKEIVGKWLLQSGKLILEFTDKNIIVSKNTRIISKGTYKIIGNRLIYTGTQNGTSVFEIFLKDMIILKEKGKEYTYERLQ